MFTLKPVYQEIYDGDLSYPVYKDKKNVDNSKYEYIQLLGMFDVFKNKKLKTYGSLKQKTWLYVDDVENKIKQELKEVESSHDIYTKEKMLGFFTSLEEMVKKSNSDVEPKIMSEMHNYIDFSLAQLQKITEAG